MSENKALNALKLAYRNIQGDVSAGTEETVNALIDALCEIMGDQAFHDFLEYEVDSFE